MKLGLNLKPNNRRSAGGLTSLLLDLYPGAAAAYALVSLSNSYTGPVVRVRRSSDNAESDFTSVEITDGTLLTFVDGNDGLITTIYNQSGSGLGNLIQTASGRQPFIVVGGVLQLENNIPTARIINTRFLICDGFDTLAMPLPYSFFLGATIKTNTTNAYGNVTFFIGGEDGSVSLGKYELKYSPGLVESSSLYRTTTPVQNINSNVTFLDPTILHLHTALYSLTDVTTIVNSTNIGSPSAIVEGSNNNYTKLYVSGSNTQTTNGTINFSFLVFYPTDQSANRTGIEAALNSIYSIY